MFESLVAHCAKELADVIDKTGYGVVENYISSQTLEKIKSQVHRGIDETWNDLVAPPSTLEDDGFLDQWRNAPAFLEFCDSLATESYGEPFQPRTKETFRVLHGESSSVHARLFHYDSFLVTAILPLIAPRESGSCDLYLVPNARPYRRNYVQNVMDKLWIGSPVMQRYFERKVKQSKLVKLKMIPGNLYFFWGYRSIHASERFDKSGIRCTAVMHYGIYHRSSEKK